MAYSRQAPTEKKEDRAGGEAVTYEHPAFGCIEVVRSSANGMELFNSALSHQHMLTIKVSHAELVRRHHDEHIYSNLAGRIVEFHMSEAQWATFVSSQGGGNPTPITLRAHRDGSYIDCPGIKSSEQVKDTFEREIREKAARDIAEAKQIAADLGKLLEGKTVGKTELKELHRRLQTFSGNFSSNMAFTQEMFAESMEKTIQQGKIEFESHVAGTVRRLGLEAMRNNGEIPQLLISKEDKEND